MINYKLAINKKIQENQVDAATQMMLLVEYGITVLG